MKKILSVLLSVCIIAGLCVPMVSLADEAATPTPVFVEDFETKPTGNDNSDWFRNIAYPDASYYKTHTTYDGFASSDFDYLDNFPSLEADNTTKDYFTNTELGYMWTADPLDSTNHALNTGKYNVNKWIIGRDLPATAENKVIEVNTYIDKDSLTRTGEYVLKVGEIKINIYGWTTDSEVYCSDTGFSYKVQNNAQAAVKWKNNVDGNNIDLHYAGTTIDMNATDGWHQFVFDYSKTADGNKPVDVYLNGVKIISTTVDTSLNGKFNYSDGAYIAFGDASDADGIKNYYFDDIRAWNAADLSYVLGLNTAPTSYHVSNKPIYENNFDDGFSFNGWGFMNGRSAKGRLTTSMRNAAIIEDPEKSTNHVLKTNNSNDFPLTASLPLALKNKVIEVWFYDDPEVWTAQMDGSTATTVIESGIYVGGSSLEGNSNGYGDAYFIGISSAGLTNNYSNGKNANYSFKFPGGAFTQTNVARTKGWHQFVIDLSVPGVQTFYFDGYEYPTKGNKTGDIDCYNIWLGDVFTGDNVNTSMYFDDLRVWNNIGEMHNGRNGKVYLRDIDFTDADGNEISSLTPGETVKTLVKYEFGKTTEDKTAKVIVAMYKDNELVEASVGTDNTVLPAKWGRVNYLKSNAEIKLPNDLTGIKLKLFVFDGLSGLKPLSTATVLPKAQ